MAEITAHSKDAIVKIGEFLESDGWHPRYDEEKLLFTCAFNGTNGNFACYVKVYGDLDIVAVYAMCPFKAAENFRHQTAEFLSRANYGMRIGNFEMDFGDGEIRYKASLDFEGTELNDKTLKNLIYPACRMMDKYMPGIMAVVSGAKTAKVAVETVEQPPA